MGGSLLARDRTFVLVSLPLPLTCSACSPDSDRTGRESVYGTTQWWLSGTRKTSPISNGIPLPCGWVTSVASGHNGPGQVRAFALLSRSLPLAISLLPCPHPRPSPRRLVLLVPLRSGEGARGHTATCRGLPGARECCRGASLRFHGSCSRISVRTTSPALARQWTNFRNAPLARISVGGSLVRVATTAAVWAPHFFAASPAPYRTCQQKFLIFAHRANRYYSQRP